MKKYKKPEIVIIDTEMKENMLVGSIGYTSDEADKNYEVLSDERNDDIKWGDIW